MKFQIETIAIKQALDIVNHATASISTTPILENILIKVSFSEIVFISNNLETAIEHYIVDKIKVESEWNFCVPSKIFINYINLLNDDLINIELLNDNSIQIKTESSNIKIKWNPFWDFPLLPTIIDKYNFYINSSVIKNAIEKTLFSSAEWNIRPNLAWIYFSINWKVAKFATTDSFRLSELKTELENPIIEDFCQIIPNKTAYQLKSLLKDNDDLKIITADNQIVFHFWSTKFYSRLLNWKFPDYEAFFPNSYNTKSVVNRLELIQSLKKINLLSRENNYSIKMSFSNESWILIETSQTQSWEWKVYIIWSIEWSEAIIWLNSEFFLEALWVIETSHISISFESALSPILITPIIEEKDTKNYLFRHIIMPLKI